MISTLFVVVTVPVAEHYLRDVRVLAVMAIYLGFIGALACCLTDPQFSILNADTETASGHYFATLSLTPLGALAGALALRTLRNYLRPAEKSNDSH